MIKPKRKGYSRAADIPQAILADLNHGKIESATLAEITTIDLEALMLTKLKKLKKKDLQSLAEAKGILKKMKAAALIVTHRYGLDVHHTLLEYDQCDTLRGIGAFVIGASEKNQADKLKAIKPYASDPHFGVREWAWMALRDDIVQHFDDYYPRLLKLSKQKNFKIRRFSIESIRPKGVWAIHLKKLKEDPEIALDILNNLKDDSNRYVQDSVANWLNDIAKNHPIWLKNLCLNWQQELGTDNEANQYIIKRATRNIHYPE